MVLHMVTGKNDKICYISWFYNSIRECRCHVCQYSFLLAHVFHSFSFLSLPPSFLPFFLSEKDSFCNPSWPWICENSHRSASRVLRCCTWTTMPSWAMASYARTLLFSMLSAGWFLWRGGHICFRQDLALSPGLPGFHNVSQCGLNIMAVFLP